MNRSSIGTFVKTALMAFSNSAVSTFSKYNFKLSLMTGSKNAFISQITTPLMTVASRSPLYKIFYVI